ncbi:MAG: hypothetical protein IJQ31_01080 [Thermoguttaceae bacterium]|nr:hypothetical protein [Thermoguttaceae bacterium]
MSSKLWPLGVLGFILVLCISGCKSCGCGRDPLLGKTRLDPPTTNARSVYVERQNVNECGVVPGGGPAVRNSSDSDPTGIIQPGAGSVQTVYYPSGLDSADESVPVSQDEKAAENSHLRWISVEVPQNTALRGPSLSDLGTSELTEEELANYRYVYDFSVMPPRKIPVGRPSGAVSAERSSAGNSAAQESSPDPYIPQPRQFVSQNFDPYAPNRQFERRKAKLSRSLATEFDEVEANPAPVQTANSEAPRNETTYEPAQVVQSQLTAKDSGWRVVATPDPASSPSDASLPNEAVADSQIAPVQQAVGTKAQVPERVPEKVQKNVPQSPKTDDDSAVDLFALPRK